MTKKLLCILLTLTTTAWGMDHAKTLPQELIYAIFDFLPLKQVTPHGYSKIHNPNRQLDPCCTPENNPAAFKFLNNTTLFPSNPLRLTCKRCTVQDLQQIATSKKVLNIVSLAIYARHDSQLCTPADHWQNFKNLKKLMLSIGTNFPQASWFAIFAAQLTSLTISGVATPWDLVHPNLQAITWSSFVNLKELKLALINIDETTLSHISEIKSLQSLKAHACIPIQVFLPLPNNWWTKIPWQNFNNLILLDLAWCDAIDDNVLRQIAQHCKKLTSLTLVGTNISREDIAFLLKNCTTLKTISSMPHENLTKHRSYSKYQNISAL